MFLRRSARRGTTTLKPTLLPLTSRSPTPDRWVPSHSPTVSCAYRAAGWRQLLPDTVALDALKHACRSSSLQASRSARSALSGCRRRWARKHTPGSRTGAHNRNR
eukprot:scaffold42825_cov42-Phaeocystis_antarctica.AAC.1